MIPLTLGIVQTSLTLLSLTRTTRCARDFALARQCLSKLIIALAYSQNSSLCNIFVTLGNFSRKKVSFYFIVNQQHRYVVIFLKQILTVKINVEKHKFYIFVCFFGEKWI